MFTITPYQSRVLGQVSEDVSVSCQASGQPPPVISWQKHTRQINTINVSGDSLVIKNATVEDAGTYVCTATNTAGVASIYIDLQITCEFSSIIHTI